MAEPTDGVTPADAAGVLTEEQAFRLIAYLTSAAEIVHLDRRCLTPGRATRRSG